MNSYLLNQGLMTSGIYRAYVIKKDDYRIYTPGLMNNSNVINSDGSLNEKNYNTLRLSLPKALFNSNALRDILTDDLTSCWVVFENGDINKPVVMGYLGKGVRTVGGGIASGNNMYDNFGQELEGGNIVDALFTAYYATPDGWSSAENILQGEPIAANGEVLDYTKSTCAAPKSIPFNTNIKVMNTNTEQDGRIYRVNDRGGAINIENGVYHFDLLMKDKQTAYAFGRQIGKAMIGEI